MESAISWLEPGVGQMSFEADRSEALRWITVSQLKWASEGGIEVDGSGRAVSVEANLFQPLNLETRREFEAGKGDELGVSGQPGKMASLISSSALAVNVFDPWRGQDATPLCMALGVARDYRVGGFEATYPTGLRGTDPHLDVKLLAPGEPVLAIESKFTEPYRRVTNSFRPSYFSRDAIWAGMPASRSLAQKIADDTIVFHSLHAAQLLKHAIGLNHTLGQGRFVLMYLWYQAPGRHGKLHTAETQRFADIVAYDFDFRSMTCQELLETVDDGPGGWIEYLRRRYLRHEPDLI